MKPGDLVHMSFPRDMLGISPFQQWNGKIGILVEEVDVRHHGRLWRVLCSGETTLLASSHLKTLDAPVRPARGVVR